MNVHAVSGDLTAAAAIREAPTAHFAERLEPEPVLLAGDLALAVPRGQLHEALGVDPLDRAGAARFAAQVVDVDSQGVLDRAGSVAPGSDELR